MNTPTETPNTPHRGRNTNPPQPTPESPPILRSPIAMTRRHDRLMTPAELAFFSVLEPIVSQSYMISSKVPLADVITTRQGEIQQAAVDVVCNTYIDFVLTDMQTGVILCAIALESDVPKQADTTRHDRIVDNLFAQSCLPLLRIPCTWTYYPQALRAELLKAGLELPGAV